MEKQKIEFNIPANLHFSSLVRNIAEEVFSFVHFSKGWCNRLKLVVDELFMNAVKYGSTENQSMVHIYFTYNDKEVQFQIEDDGTGPQVISAETLKSLIYKNANQNDVTKTSGRGLAMITTLWTDKLDIKESSYGGITIAFSKTIETQPPPPPPLVKAVISQSAEPSKSIEQKKPEGSAATMPAFTVKLHGDIDQLNIDKLVLLVNEQIATLPKEATLVLDFSELDYINSTFIGLLASWLNDVKQKGGQIVLKNINDQIKDVLNLVGLGKVLNIE
jgi:anti-anti-sigma factor